MNLLEVRYAPMRGRPAQLDTPLWPSHGLARPSHTHAGGGLSPSPPRAAGPSSGAPTATCRPSLTERQSAASPLLLLGTTLAWISLHGIDFEGDIQGQRPRAFSVLRGVATLSRGFRVLGASLALCPGSLVGLVWAKGAETRFSEALLGSAKALRLVQNPL